MESECEPKPYEASFVDGPRSRCLSSLEWGDSEWRQNDLIYNWSWFHCIALLSLSLSLSLSRSPSLSLTPTSSPLLFYRTRTHTLNHTHKCTHTHTTTIAHTHALAWHFSDPIFLLSLIPAFKKKCFKEKKTFRWKSWFFESATKLWGAKLTNVGKPLCY